MSENLKKYFHASAQYINWLSFANVGMLNRGSIYCMDLAVKNQPSKNHVLKIGTCLSSGD